MINYQIKKLKSNKYPLYYFDGKLCLKMWYSLKKQCWIVYNGIHYMYWKNEIDAKQMYDFHVEVFNEESIDVIA